MALPASSGLSWTCTSASCETVNADHLRRCGSCGKARIVETLADVFRRKLVARGLDVQRSHYAVERVAAGGTWSTILAPLKGHMLEDASSVPETVVDSIADAVVARLQP